MTRFALRYPYLIIVSCLVTCVIGLTCVLRMPVDLFPPIRIPVVVVATFFTGMPPEQIENDISGRFERFFTLASGIEHIESRSLPGVSLIKIYFQPGTDPDTAVSIISNLATADLRRLPPGTLPPVVLKFDASSLPVCLITLKGQGLDETQLRDLGQFSVRNQVANVAGASVPQPFGGRYRQIMVYVDPLKLEAHQLSLMDVVRSVNDSNLILPSGDVKIGPLDYNLYPNAQLDTVDDVNHLPLKSTASASVLIEDVGHAEDAAAIQTSIVRIDGQRSVYLPVLKQGGDSNTIAIVDGVRRAIGSLVDVPASLATKLVFDQSVFVRNAIANLVHEGVIGLVLTALMILLFLANLRATLGTFLSIPLSALATFVALYFGDATINTMILGGLALVFSRLIDNSVVVLENIFRHREHGATALAAAEIGGREVALPVLASTLATAAVFFPVTFLAGVSRYLFSAMAAAVVLALLASFLVATTVVPLFCAHALPLEAVEDAHAGARRRGLGERFRLRFNAGFAAFLDAYERLLATALRHPLATVLTMGALCAALVPLGAQAGIAYFPRTDPGQFTIQLKAPSGTRLEDTERLVAQVEGVVREVVDPRDMDMVIANIGISNGFSSIYSSNAGPHTAVVQCSLVQGHHLGSEAYMSRVRARLARDVPQVASYIQAGGLMDAILNMGMPAPIDIQIAGSDLQAAHALGQSIASELRAAPGIGDVFVPQDVDYPSISLLIDRQRASQLGLDSKEVIDNIITALTSNSMIAPSYWVDPRSGNDYMLTVQYPERQVRSWEDLSAIPLRAAHGQQSIRLGELCTMRVVDAPTEVDHFQLQRTIDLFVAPRSEELRPALAAVHAALRRLAPPAGMRIAIRGAAESMVASFTRFALGLLLSGAIVYLILVAQFRSFLDPLLILLAMPTGFLGVLAALLATGTTINVMSLMGVIMMMGIVVSNSILIVDVAHHLRQDGRDAADAAREACRMRMRPILMTTLATLFGLLPMAFHLGSGSEAYAPLAIAVIGGLACSTVLTMFLVPAAFVLAYRGRPALPA